MSKRAFDEIPDEEWDSEAFNPSIIFKRDPAPPPLESFAYRSSNVRRQPPEPSHVINLEDDIDEDDQIFAPAPAAARGKRFVVNEDSDEEEVREVVKVENVGSRKDKAQSKVFKLSDDELDELIEAVGDEDDIYEEDEVEEEELMVNESEPDLVGEALRKCAQISSELRRELYGSSARSCDRYAEVESSSVRIVTQDDVSEACANEEAGFEPILKPYQLVGVNFLLLLHRKNIGGAILADEMGLGKTVQAVTYLNLLKHLYNDPGPHLIVSPASLLENWQRELERWCPSFSVILFHGSGRTIFSKELSSLGKAGKPPPFNVLLACYSLFERRSEQQKDGRKVLKYWPWSCVLLDEAHALKDKGSYRWKCLMAVAKTARQRLLLTGTPLQNSLHELWSLLEFMMPKIFATENVDLKKLLNSHDDSLISRIKSILGPFILRRLKTDVMQQLVQKVQCVDYVTMEAEQFQVYQDAINEYRSVSQARIVKLQGDNKDKPITLSKSQISNYFMQFRKIANHPLLVRHIYKDNDILRYAKVLYAKGAFGFECNVERVIQELHTYNDFEIHRLLLSYLGAGVGTLDDQHVLGSAKCQALAKLLPSLQKSGSRVLIFSQWTSMLDILEWTLDVIGLTYKRLDGSTQVLERQNIVDTFNNDPTIFACLLSTRAGGQGLNLIGANTVIIHDMDFNPQIDRQAEDRCHRIGQTKPVTVYRLVTKGTVDENIYEIAKRKLLLDAAVLQNGPEQDNDIDMPEKTMGEILSSLLLV